MCDPAGLWEALTLKKVAHGLAIATTASNADLLSDTKQFVQVVAWNRMLSRTRIDDLDGQEIDKDTPLFYS